MGEQGEKKQGGRTSSSCLECQRRKQRCNREWPCNHCHARKVPHLCQFPGRKTSPTEDSSPSSGIPTPKPSRKRKDNDAEAEADLEVDLETQDVSVTLEAMGFGVEQQHYKLGVSVVEKTDMPPEAKAREVMSNELQQATETVLPRYITDKLVQLFLHGGNYFYYIVYPPQFSDQYKQWWEDRNERRPVSPQVTCLILRVCACSAQFLPAALREEVRREIGADSQELSQRFHAACQRLSGTIPPGKGGLVQIQQVFLSAFWFKSESRWVESWHALGAAILEAQELGMHQDSRMAGLSEFEIDMRRRIWSLLYVWDWQISLLFGRPLIINHSSCAFELPKPKVYSPTDGPDAPSPFGHMLLQCQLIRRISKRFGVIEIPLPMETAVQLQEMVQEWIDAFPPIYSTTHTDHSLDVRYGWLCLQRPYLHAISYAMMLIPLKPYVINSVSAASGALERDVRRRGVDICIRLMDTAKVLFDTVYPNDAKFHFSFFALFDTSAVLCSAILHDVAGTLPRRPEILAYVRSAVDMLRQLSPITETACTAFKVLKKLVADLPLEQHERAILGLVPVAPKRQRRQQEIGAGAGAGAQEGGIAADGGTGVTAEAAAEYHGPSPPGASLPPSSSSSASLNGSDGRSNNSSSSNSSSIPATTHSRSDINTPAINSSSVPAAATSAGGDARGSAVYTDRAYNTPATTSTNGGDDTIHHPFAAPANNINYTAYPPVAGSNSVLINGQSVTLDLPPPPPPQPFLLPQDHHHDHHSAAAPPPPPAGAHLSNSTAMPSVGGGGEDALVTLVPLEAAVMPEMGPLETLDVHELGEMLAREMERNDNDNVYGGGGGGGGGAMMTAADAAVAAASVDAGGAGAGVGLVSDLGLGLGAAVDAAIADVVDIGDLGMIWDWQTLDLGMGSPGPISPGPVQPGI